MTNSDYTYSAAASPVRAAQQLGRRSVLSASSVKDDNHVVTIPNTRHAENKESNRSEKAKAVERNVASSASVSYRCVIMMAVRFFTSCGKNESINRKQNTQKEQKTSDGNIMRNKPTRPSL